MQSMNSYANSQWDPLNMTFITLGRFSSEFEIFHICVIHSNHRILSPNINQDFNKTEILGLYFGLCHLRASVQVLSVKIWPRNAKKENMKESMKENMKIWPINAKKDNLCTLEYGTFSR